jgi:hypothetical protein
MLINQALSEVLQLASRFQLKPSFSRAFGCYEKTEKLAPVGVAEARGDRDRSGTETAASFRCGR